MIRIKKCKKYKKKKLVKTVLDQQFIGIGIGVWRTESNRIDNDTPEAVYVFQLEIVIDTIGEINILNFIFLIICNIILQCFVQSKNLKD